MVANLARPHVARTEGMLKEDKAIFEPDLLHIA